MAWAAQEAGDLWRVKHGADGSCCAGGESERGDADGNCSYKAGRLDLLDINFHAVNLSDRKDLMLQESDVMVALPGGIGTLDEIFHVAASASIGYHNKKVILYNVDGFWDEMLRFFEKLGRLHFTHRSIDNYILVAGSFDELVAMLDK